jgi:hypothetical protein
MPIKPDNTYNIDKKFDYFTIKAMVIECLQKILLAAKQEQEQGQQQQTITFDYKALVGEEGDDDDDNKQDEINQDEEITSESIDISNISTATITSNNLSDNDYDGVDDNIKLSRSILKRKIRNTTEYLRWRIAVIKRDNFRCQICSASIKENKAVRLEVHHAKTFNDICTDNNIQA